MVKSALQMGISPSLSDADHVQRSRWIHGVMIGCGFECKEWNDICHFKGALKKRNLYLNLEFIKYRDRLESTGKEIWLVLEDDDKFDYVYHETSSTGFPIEHKYVDEKKEVEDEKKEKDDALKPRLHIIVRKLLGEMFPDNCCVPTDDNSESALVDIIGHLVFQHFPDKNKQK
jgi:hypothetical protein